MGTRFKEHTSRKGTNSAIKEHLEAQGHTCTLDEVKILEKEDDWFKRKVKEAILIHRHQPTLNRDKGLELPPQEKGKGGHPDSQTLTIPQL